MYSKTAYSLVNCRVLSSLFSQTRGDMSATGSAAQAPRFIRRTQLGSQEYRTNFRQLDCEVIGALVSEEATRVTSQMSKIYLGLINAPAELWERAGVLRFTGCEREGKWQTAWQRLVEMAGVASATARKALAWMSEQGIIGYYAGKNGVGIRIFINRAASSIARKPVAGQKNLHLIPTSSGVPRTSPDEVAFKDSYAVLETLETDINSPAPHNGADNKSAGNNIPAPPPPPPTSGNPPPPPRPRDPREGKFQPPRSRPPPSRSAISSPASASN